MGILNNMAPEPLYSSEPPYYTYGAPQGSLQPAQPPQGTTLAPQQQPVQKFAKGGQGSPARQNLEKLRTAAGLQEEDIINPDRLQDLAAPEGPLDDAAGPEEVDGESFYVEGPGTGRSDEIDAKLSDGEYVFDAETVALLGDGSSKAGAAQLDALRERIRAHKGAALAKGKISPDAKPAEQYLKGAK